MKVIVNNCLYLNLKSFSGMITFVKILNILLGVAATTAKPKGFFYTINYGRI